MIKYPLNKEKLEKLLIKEWTNFIDSRKIIKFLESYKKTPNRIRITRFELIDTGFIVWINYTSDGQEFTSEFLVNDEKFIHVTTI